MNLRFPLVVAVVALAAGTAAVRALQPRSPAATLSPVPSAATLGPRRPLPQARPQGRTIVVYVAGEVARAGLYTVPATARGADALRLAGGPLPSADLIAVNLAARLQDGDELAVPPRGAKAPRAARSRALRASTGRGSSRSKRHKRRRPAIPPGAITTAENADGPSELVDLNSADSDALQSLPGIGAALAERIITVRDRSGPFASTDDLLDVGGMTQSKLDAIAPYVVLR